jgi:hypothetical protein
MRVFPRKRGLRQVNKGGSEKAAVFMLAKIILQKFLLQEVFDAHIFNSQTSVATLQEVTDGGPSAASKAGRGRRGNASGR